MDLTDKEIGTSVFHRPVKQQHPPHTWRAWLIGRPLATADAPHQTIGKVIGLAVFASDALSSTAYATQEILFILAVAGTAAFSYSMPIALAIVALLAIVVFSYQQTIRSYPNSASAYIVTRDNLGTLPALITAASLLTDYILTVAVSISSGVAQITSAFPALFDFRVEIAVAMVLFIMLINLRGVKESGLAFAVPTYFFLLMMFLSMGVGFFRYLSGSLSPIADPPELELHGALQPVTLFLLLHAFSSGTTALTGIEAISDGVPAFKEPRTRNANVTLIWMGTILSTLFLSITFLSSQIGAIPSETETVISQLARAIYDGRNIFYLVTLGATTVILIMAANTAYADFPRLSALMANDRFFPRQFTYRGSRLVFSRGIVTLALLASLLIIAFQASVTALIPLYAIGVFFSFTASQAGMAHRWWKSGQLAPGQTVQEPGSVLQYEPHWRLKLGINSFGALCTGVVMLIFAVTKFTHGAWIVLLLIPILVVMFFAINHHYRDLAQNLSLKSFDAPLRFSRHRVIMLVSGVHQGTLAGLRYARLLSDDITAVHVSTNPEESEKIRYTWEQWGNGVRLVILDSPYRLLLEPLLEYIDTIDARRQSNEIITIVVPQFVPRHWWHNLLHTQAAFWLRIALLFRPGIVITDVPYQMKSKGD
jgi:amino acid transporter